MTDHIDIPVLESAILAPDTLGSEKLERIRLHLKVCAFCREQMESLEHMYLTVEEELKASPSERDRQGAARILPRGLVKAAPEERIIEAYSDLVEPYRRPLRHRLTRLIKLHPYRSTGAFVVVAAGLAILVSLFTSTKDQNPTFAEIKNYVLYAYNKESEVVWKKGVPGLPDWTSRTSPIVGNDYPTRYLSVDDVDGDNLNEVLLVGSSLGGEFAGDTIYCFNQNGNLRWKTGIGPMISFGHAETTRHSIPQIVDFLVLRKNPRSRPQIFILANEQIYSPNKLFEVSARDGSILQSFFNRGGCDILTHKDIDLDGNEELLLGGINDGFNRASLAILDPALVAGYSPVPLKDEPVEGGGGAEKYYLLFPRWSLGLNGGNRLYNSVGRIIDLQGGGVDVAVSEVLQDPENIRDVSCSLFFSLGPTLAVDRIIPDDTIIKIGTILYKRGKLREPITKNTYSLLKDSVLYWDGNRFENAPTINKGYKNPVLTPSVP